MSQQKHFNYQGHVELKPKAKNIEVLDVSFLTPARVKAKVDGIDVEINVGVDIINRKVYDDRGESYMSEQIFDYLDRVNSLPDDFFEASEDIYNEAVNAKEEHDSVMEKMSNV